MTASEIPLRATIAAQRKEIEQLRKALAETTRQLVETVEELKICALPFFRAWRLRRLLRRREKAVKVLKEGVPQQPVKIAAAAQPARKLIVIPGQETKGL